MTLSMHSASVAVLDNGVRALINIIGKAKAHCEAKKIDPDALTQARLYPDMFPFWRQVCLVSDHAKGAPSRLAGVDVPSWPDTERSFDELLARLEKTRAYLKEFPTDRLAGSDTRTITMKLGGQDVSMPGDQYLFTSALPNFFFHLTTAYNILREGGVEVGKRDFLGRT